MKNTSMKRKKEVKVGFKEHVNSIKRHETIRQQGLSGFIQIESPDFFIWLWHSMNTSLYNKAFKENIVDYTTLLATCEYWHVDKPKQQENTRNYFQSWCFV
jgi:hypothetical protein